MAPFYRVFANTLGNGPWFDTYIQNLPPVPQVGGRDAAPGPEWSPRLIVAALVVAAGLASFLLGGSPPKTFTAEFPRTVSLYEGSDVRVLGVPVGKVDSVTPSGTQVVVTMHYDSDVQVPARRQGGDHLPVDRGRPLRPAHPRLHWGPDPRRRRSADRAADRRTAGARPHLLQPRRPDRGPRSATAPTQKGALTNLLDTTARNFGGQGQKFHRTIESFSRLSRHPGRQQGPALRHRPRARGLRRARSPTTTGPCAPSTPRWRRCPTCSGRARRPRGISAQPRPSRMRRGGPASCSDNRRCSSTTSPGSTGSPRCCQAARRARRDAAQRAAGAEQPGPDLQPPGRHARHPRQPRRARSPAHLRPSHGPLRSSSRRPSGQRLQLPCSSDPRHRPARRAQPAAVPRSAPYVGEPHRPTPRRTVEVTAMTPASVDR